MSFRSLRTVALAATVLSGPALAGTGFHHHRHRSMDAGLSRADFYGYGGYGGQPAYGGYYGAAGWEADVNARRTAQAYHEPGVTLELAPDSKQTATGGPSGGVPGFSGH